VYKKGITVYFRSFLLPKEEKREKEVGRVIAESGFLKIRTFGL
jgi:hypothetical protein